MNELIELQKGTEELRWLGVMVLWSILVILLVCAGIYHQWCWWRSWGGSLPWENRNPNQKPRLNHDDDSLKDTKNSLKYD